MKTRTARDILLDYRNGLLTSHEATNLLIECTEPFDVAIVRSELSAEEFARFADHVRGHATPGKMFHLKGGGWASAEESLEHARRAARLRDLIDSEGDL